MQDSPYTKSLAEQYRAIKNRVVLSRIKVMLITGFTLFPLFTILDWVVYPEFAKGFVPIRIIVTAVLGILLYLCYNYPVQKYAFWIMHASLYNCACGIIYMTYATEGILSSYREGLNLVLLALVFCNPFSMLHTCGLCALIILTYYFACYMHDPNWTWQQFVPTVYFLGNMVVFLVIMTPVLVRQHYRLFLNQLKFRSLFDSSSDAVMLWDENGFIDCNEETVKLFGLKNKKEILSKHPAELSPRVQPNGEISKIAARKKLDEAQKLGKAQFEWIHQRADGEKIPTEIWLTVVRMGEKNIIQATIRDVTDRKRFESIMIHQDKMAAVGQLAGGVAHEINNPLCVILGFAQGLVRRLEPGDPRTEQIKTIEREALRCKELVRDLLTFSRNEAPERESIDINDAIEGSLSLITAQSRFKDVTFCKELRGGLPKVFANQVKIQQIIVNLASNAIDAMKEGGRLTILTRKVTENEKTYVEIQVADTGKGIPDDIRKRIFEPFFTTKEIGEGSGLGLSLVYEIVQQHEGDIRVESTAEKGTTFHILIPAVSYPKKLEARSQR